MALPMAHLLAAYFWTEEHPELRNCPEYYLGAIAPDAIHVRDGNDKSRKDMFHFYNWRRPNESRVAEYWKRCNSPFDMGYGIHVLLDGHWASGFRRDFPQILREDGRPIPEMYYNDACAVDREFYETSPYTEFFFEMLEKAVAPQDHEMLTAGEFEQWRRDTFEFYANPKMAFGEAKYITAGYTMDFLKRCPSCFTRVLRAVTDDSILLIDSEIKC